MRKAAAAVLAAAAALLAGAGASAAAPEHPGQRLVRENNCAACHQIGPAPPARPASQAGPPLDQAGRRLQPDWLKGFLARPHKVRPGEPYRMPDFRLADWEAESLAAFAAGLRAPWPVPPAGEGGAAFAGLYARLPEGNPREGRALFERLECAKCHADPAGGAPAPSPPDIGPDLRLAARRLTREGLAAVLYDPAMVRPGTKMPSFFYDQGEPLGPDAPRQLADLAAYLESPGGPRPRVLDLTSGGFAAGAGEWGRRLALRFNCAGCHAGTGLGPRHPAQVAPPLGYRNAPSAYTRAMAAAWLREPATIPMHERMMGFGRMPAFGFTQEEARAIADWLFTFDGPPGRMMGGMLMMQGRGGGMR